MGQEEDMMKGEGRTGDGDGDGDGRGSTVTAGGIVTGTMTI